jgi:hypothetical protein
LRFIVRKQLNFMAQVLGDVNMSNIEKKAAVRKPQTVATSTSQKPHYYGKGAFFSGRRKSSKSIEGKCNGGCSGGSCK